MEIRFVYPADDKTGITARVELLTATLGRLCEIKVKASDWRRVFPQMVEIKDDHHLILTVRDAGDGRAMSIDVASIDEVLVY